jgi:hypothetical protein
MATVTTLWATVALMGTFCLFVGFIAGFWLGIAMKETEAEREFRARWNAELRGKGL